MPPEMVRVTNLAEQDFCDSYAAVTYRIPPKDKIIVPWGAACLWFGDPALIDKPTLAQFDRQDEIQRLYMRMGCYDGDGGTALGRFLDRRPQVEVASLDGNVTAMLIDQFDGNPASIPTSLPHTDEREALASELERMKAMQAELLQRLNVLEAGEESFDELPTDTPTQVPVDN